MIKDIIKIKDQRYFFKIKDERSDQNHLILDPISCGSQKIGKSLSDFFMRGARVRIRVRVRVRAEAIGKGCG